MRSAVYAGSFDPVTHGHLSVIARAARLFDRLLVVVAVNPEKSPLFTVAERLEMLREAVAEHGNVACASTPGLVVAFAQAAGARFLVRGVRDSTDLEGELALCNLNRTLAPEVVTVFVPAAPDLSQVSSSRLKEMAARGEDLSGCCPAGVAGRLLARLPEAPTARRPEVRDAAA